MGILWKDCLSCDIMARFQAVQDALAESSGLSIVVMDDCGNPCTIPSNQPSTCFSYRINNAELCDMSIRRCIKEVERLLEPVSIQCHGGLSVWVVPLGLLPTESITKPAAYLTIIGKAEVGESENPYKKSGLIYYLSDLKHSVETVSMVFDLLFSLAVSGGLITPGIEKKTEIVNDNRYENLTKREREILRLVATGLTNMSIAKTLFISDKTVKTHITNILTKLNFENRTEMALYAVQVAPKLNLK